MASIQSLATRTLCGALIGVFIGSCTSGQAPPINEEQRLRDALGIPRDAQKVIVFGQNSHLDINWEFTTDEYYTQYVQEIFDEALDDYKADGDTRYAVCEMEYLHRYWQARPERQAELMSMVASGHFKAVGGAVSSPDVLLPLGEALLHDYRAGTSWLKSTGMSRTSTAYLPDDFGLGPNTPEILNASGIDGVAFWRMDGDGDEPNYNAGVADFANPVLAPNSNAAKVAAGGAIDFMWQSPYGGQVFAHWLMHGYNFGDYIDYKTITTRALGQPLGVVQSDPSIINANIAEYIKIVEPLSPTDYMFVPVGGDFQFPKAHLAKFARDWNSAKYASTGVWAIDATFDDFKQLAVTQKTKLPTYSLDMTPYWMGFYGSRTSMKRDIRTTSAKLTMLEKLALITQGLGGSLSLDDVNALWWWIGDTDHHDWITGTANDHVLDNDQLPNTAALTTQTEGLLEQQMTALASGAATNSAVVFNSESYPRDAVANVAITSVPSGTQRASVSFAQGAPVAAQLSSDQTSVFFATSAATPIGATRYDVTFSNDSPAPGLSRNCVDIHNVAVKCSDISAVTMTLAAGDHSATLDLTQAGAITSLTVGGKEWLDGPSGEIVVYDDGGGLYTFGDEDGSSCAFGLWNVADDDATGTTVSILEDGPVLTRVAIDFTADGLSYEKRLTFYAESPNVDLQYDLETLAGTSVMARMSFAQSESTATMAVPGGVTTRTIGQRFAPTFEPFEQWFAWGDDLQSTTIVAPANPAITYDSDGTVMLVLDRSPSTSGCGGHTLGTATPFTSIAVRLAPHSGPVLEETRYRDAADLWFPLLAQMGSASTSTSPATQSFASLDSATAHVTSMHRDADGALVTHILRPGLASETAALTLANGVSSVEQINTTEDGAVPLTVTTTPSILLPLNQPITATRMKLTAN